MTEAPKQAKIAGTLYELIVVVFEEDGSQMKHLHAAIERVRAVDGCKVMYRANYFLGIRYQVPIGIVNPIDDEKSPWEGKVSVRELGKISEEEWDYTPYVPQATSQGFMGTT